MHNKEEFPFHTYADAFQNVKDESGYSLLNFDESFPFMMTQFGIMNETAQTGTPHRHDYYEIIYVEEGEGTHIIDFEPYPLQTPGFYFLTKGQVHFWQLTKELQGKVILFPREFLIPPVVAAHIDDDLMILNGLSKAPCVQVKPTDAPKINELLYNINEEYLRKSESSITILRAYVHILLVNLLRIHASNQEVDILNASNAIVQKFRQLVSENYLLERSVQAYADLLGVSATHLRDTVKGITGYSPGQLIRQEIIYEAKRKLANTELTTAQIGYSLNFEDTSYFSCFFKRESGLSPSAYREDIRKKYQIKI